MLLVFDGMAQCQKKYVNGNDPVKVWNVQKKNPKSNKLDQARKEVLERYADMTMYAYAIDGFHSIFHYGNWRALHHHAACWWHHDLFVLQLLSIYRPSYSGANNVPLQTSEYSAWLLDHNNNWTQDNQKCVRWRISMCWRVEINDSGLQHLKWMYTQNQHQTMVLDKRHNFVCSHTICRGYNTPSSQNQYTASGRFYKMPWLVILVELCIWNAIWSNCYTMLCCCLQS